MSDDVTVTLINFLIYIKYTGRRVSFFHSYFSINLYLTIEATVSVFRSIHINRVTGHKYPLGKMSTFRKQTIKQTKPKNFKVNNLKAKAH